MLFPTIAGWASVKTGLVVPRRGHTYPEQSKANSYRTQFPPYEPSASYKLTFRSDITKTNAVDPMPSQRFSPNSGGDEAHTNGNPDNTLDISGQS